MATIDNKDFIDRLIANGGHYEDDPPVIEIASYRTPEGKLTYHVSWTEQDRANLRTSPFVSEIQVIWHRNIAAPFGFQKRLCVECGQLGYLDQMGCCSAECDIAHEAKHPGCCDGPEE